MAVHIASAAQINANGSDAAFNVTFSLEPVFSKLVTQQNGGLLTYVDMDLVTVVAPGPHASLINS
jgi:hypothetical protein